MHFLAMQGFCCFCCLISPLDSRNSMMYVFLVPITNMSEIGKKSQRKLLSLYLNHAFQSIKFLFALSFASG